MRVLAKTLRRATGLPTLAVLGAMVLAGCGEMPGQADGLYFRSPVSKGSQSVVTTLSSAEVAQAIRAAGFTDVRELNDGTVRLRSTNPALVDCGTVIQVALGNRAAFPGNAPEAVLMAGFSTPGLIKREIKTASEVRLTPLSGGKGYAIDEAHRVTRTFVSLTSRTRSTSSVTFDESTVAALPDATSCRASGYVGALLR